MSLQIQYNHQRGFSSTCICRYSLALQLKGCLHAYLMFVMQLYLRPYLNQASLEYAAAAAVKSAREHTTAALAISHVVFGLATLRLLLWLYGKRPVYLMDFYCFRPPNHLAGSNEDFLRGAALTEVRYIAVWVPHYFLLSNASV